MRKTFSNHKKQTPTPFLYHKLNLKQLINCRLWGVYRQRSYTLYMTPNESTRFENALRNHFNEYQTKIVKVILSGEGNFNQEDIIRTSEESIRILRKLGWYKRFKEVAKEAGLHLFANNQIII